tara:strand:- start:83 stop:418 length:336 start_codon:yes stop_codon:yes gene_type:complete
MNFDRKNFVEYIKTLETPVFVKLTATWCNPCKQIAPFINEWFKKLDEKNIPHIEIDIDESIDLFAMLKSKRMVQGVPTVLFYNEENESYIPDDSVSGTDENMINNFFNSNM